MDSEAAHEDDNRPRLSQRNEKSPPREIISTALALTPVSPSPGRAKRPQLQVSQLEAEAEAIARAVEASPPVKKKSKKDEKGPGVLINVMLPNADNFTCNLYASMTDSTANIHDQIHRLWIDWTEKVENGKKSGNFKGDQSSSSTPSRPVKWGPQIWLEDYRGETFTYESFLAAVPVAKKSEPVYLVLYDGEPEPVYKKKNMYDITPKADMLRQLPQGYCIQTALADHVDNALQAVWHNAPGDVRLVSVMLSADTITIFDTGHGMDCTAERNIANWGTVGSSTHRAVHHEAVGLDPPFLTPYLGKYGAGGVAAALHLGSLVIVSSKTKTSKKVWSLCLDKNALLEKQAEHRSWKAAGACRDMTKDEKTMSPHGSFTKVEITQLKSQYDASDGKEGFFTVDQIRELLKDVYYPYIQTETGTSSETIFPVRFLVNKLDLLEVTQCQTAIAKMATCNGEPFVIDVHMTNILDERDPNTDGHREEVANARITCHYYPYQKGQEVLESVIDELKKLKPTTDMNFDSFRRVSIRWLGRLLPDVPWRILPFMEIAPTRNKQRLDVQQQWARRVCAYVDTDAGFHPTLSKTQLERDQPFVVALQNLGKDDLRGTSGQGVKVNIKQGEKNLSPAQLTTGFREWVKHMHVSFDEEFKFLDEATYIFDHLNIEDTLGVRNKIVIFHKHMIHGKNEFQVGGHTPLWIKVPKGKGSKTETDIYGTVECFYHDGMEDEPGDVKFLYRPLGEENGCRIIQKDGICHFELNKSKWLHATKLSTAVVLDETAWRRKIEEVFNKSPSHIDVLREEDLKKLELGEAFPRDQSQQEAGLSLPKELYVVVRPKKGSGPTFRQGMIAMDTVKLGMTIMHCSCSFVFCTNERNGGSSGQTFLSHFNEHHGKIITKLSALPAAVKGSIRGIYMFSLGSTGIEKLVNKGTYVFHIFAEEDQYATITPASSTVLVLPSEVTAKWTLCNHKDVCKLAEHDTSKRSAIKIRLNEPLQQEFFLQKYDKYGNLQSFDASLDLEATVKSSKGKELGMNCKVRAAIPNISMPNGRLRLLVKNVLFRSGSLDAVESSYEGVLHIRCPADHKAEMNCKVLPGEVASVQVKDSWPSVPLRLCGSVLPGEEVSRSKQGKDKWPLNLPDLCFQEALQPGEVVKRLTLQGFDEFGNKIDKGQTIHLQLTGLELQDENTGARQVDEQGCMYLGGLLKVSCHYNSEGSLKIMSSKRLELCTIHFKTVKRLLFASKVPHNAYVGRELEGVCVHIVDENGHVDTAVDGPTHSLTVDWLEGVAYPLTKGICVLKAFKLPAQPGPWKGNVYFSANQLLHATLTVNLELAPAHSLAPASRESAVLTAPCGSSFLVPFLVLDEQQQRTVLPEGMEQQIEAKVEALDSADGDLRLYRPCTVKVQAIQMVRGQDAPSYEARIVISGSVGRYKLTLAERDSQLAGKIESNCNLQHGALARLSLMQPSSTDVSTILKPLTILEAPRCKPLPTVTIFLVDSEENICTSCDNRLLQMTIPEFSDPGWPGFEVKVTEGVGKFILPPVLLPVHNYQAAIELIVPPENWYSPDEPLKPQKAEFTLQVVHGNYPAALRLSNSDPIHKSLEGISSEYVPPLSVLVESADGKGLQDRPIVGVRLHAPSGTGQDIREYFGSFVDTIYEDGASNCKDLKYDFNQICAPCQVGTYQMEFFVRDSEVEAQFQLLHVKHGPPARVEIIRSAPEQEMDPLLVKLVDAHGNICEDCPEVEVQLKLSLSVPTPNPPCSVMSKNETRMINGKGDFGRFVLSEGEEGRYNLVVSVCGGNVPIVPAECTIFVGQGNVGEKISRECCRKQKRLKEIENSISLYQRRLEELSEQEKRCKNGIDQTEGEKKDLERQEESLRLERERKQDERTLVEMRRQPFRSSENVIRDVTMRGYSAARALLDAQSGNNFLSPQSQEPAARDVLGLVVLLACVESNALNNELSKFLGVSNLMTIVCRTQQGVDTLEGRDQNHNIIDNRGLHGFARNYCRYEISEDFEAYMLPLSDVRYYRRRDGQPCVDLSHPQCLLKMDPPVLRNGQVPAGFLGFAVNLLHLTRDQLQIRVRNRNEGEGGLRESLFFHLFKFLEVYDTRRNLMAAKDLVQNFSGSAISLDGASIRNSRQPLGRRQRHSTLCFGSIQPEEIIAGSLLPPRQDAFERAHRAEIFSKEIKNRSLYLKQIKLDLIQAIEEIKTLQAPLGESVVEGKLLKTKIKHLEAELEEFLTAKKAIDASCSRTGNEGQRLFMM